MSRVYVTQEPGGHEVSLGVTYEPPDGFALELIEQAERDGHADDGAGGTIDLVEVPAYVIVVTWEEPETGVMVHGIYGDDRAAHADVGRVLEDYMVEGELGEDVEYHVQAVQNTGQR
jgi:hypothetical protein